MATYGPVQASNNFVNSVTNPVNLGNPQQSSPGFIGPVQPSVQFGKSSIPVVNYATEKTGSAPGASTSNTGGTGGTGGSPVVSNPNPQPSGPSSEEQARMQAINDAYSGYNSYFGQAENALNSDRQSALTSAEGDFNINSKMLGNQLAQGQGTLAGNEKAAGVRKEDAMTAARRTFGELQQGGRQRFGGASSAGQAFSELSNRELMRNQGGINTGYESAIQEIAGQKLKLEQDHQMGLMQLEKSKQDSIAKVNSDFQNKMAEIGRMRAETEAAKGQQRLQALQDLRNQVYSIQLQNQQFAQQLAMQKAADSGTLDKYLASLQGATATGAGAVNTFGSVAGANTGTNLAVNPTTKTTAPISQTGYANPLKKKDENLSIYA